MNTNLQFIFDVNKSDKSITIKREFNASLNLVWDAWTKPEILDQWWAPKPYQTKTISMDFKEGGTWLYYMVSPENVKHFCKAEYKSINALESYTALDAFCDENGKTNEEFPRSLWNNSFSEKNNITSVQIVIQYDSLEHIEKIISLGFKDGLTMALSNLDQYIETQFKLRK